jgi:hypothetical protein
MEEVSRMFDLDAVLKTPWEKAGYVTRKMLVAAEQARIETAAEAEAKVAKIVKNILAQGMAPETVAAVTEMEIEKVREIAGSGNKAVN